VLAEVSGHNSWLTVLATIIPGLLLIYVYCGLLKKSSQPFPQMLEEHLGIAGRIIALFYVLVFLLLASLYLRFFVEFLSITVLHNTPTGLIIMALLIPGVYTIRSSLEVFARVSEVILWVFLPLAMLMLQVSSTEHPDIGNLMPLAFMGIKDFIYSVYLNLWHFANIIIILTLAYFSLQREQIPRLLLTSLVSLALFLASLNYGVEFQILVFAFMAFGFGTLLSMFPFHAWSPDGYAGAPTAVSMIHAGVLKKIGGYGLIRIALTILPAGAAVVAPIIAVLALGNIVYAAYICISQKDLKYIVGYSSVSHMGYVLVGIAALNLISINGAVIMMFAHGVMAALFFAMIGNLYEKSHTRNIEDFGGLAHQMPKLTAGFMIAGLASLGLPGMVNFIGEFTIFVGAFGVYRVISIIAISGIVFTALYVLRALGRMLFGARNEKWDHLQDLKGVELVPLLVLGLAIFIGGFLPFTLMDLINNGVGELLAQIGPLQIGGLW
jgi:proton-translocating NADH-quinone oxidoreductase chain M